MFSFPSLPFSYINTRERIMRPMPRITRIRKEGGLPLAPPRRGDSDNMMRMLEVDYQLMQLATPRAPAKAVSTAINTLRKETHPFPPSREGDTESIDTFTLFCILFDFLFSDKYFV
jgi:hypothetical protein